MFDVNTLLACVLRRRWQSLGWGWAPIISTKTWHCWECVCWQEVRLTHSLQLWMCVVLVVSTEHPLSLFATTTDWPSLLILHHCQCHWECSAAAIGTENGVGCEDKPPLLLLLSTMYHHGWWQGDLHWPLLFIFTALTASLSLSHLLPLAAKVMGLVYCDDYFFMYLVLS